MSSSKHQTTVVTCLFIWDSLDPMDVHKKEKKKCSQKGKETGITHARTDSSAKQPVPSKTPLTSSCHGLGVGTMKEVTVVVLGYIIRCWPRRKTVRKTNF